MDTTKPTPQDLFNACVANTYADNVARTYRPPVANVHVDNGKVDINLRDIPIGRSKEQVRNEALKAALGLIGDGNVCKVNLNYHDFGQCAYNAGLPRGTCQKQR